MAALSLTTFAADTERDTVKVQGNSAQSAYAKAVDMAAHIKSSKFEARLPMLRNCNYTGSDANDRTWFRRNAWTNTSWVSLNHVTGTYTAIVKVSCKK